MKKTGRLRVKRKKDLQARVRIATRELARLLEHVKRDRDRLAANSLTLRFVWQQVEHPHPGKLWEIHSPGNVNTEWCNTFHWGFAGHFFGRIVMPTNVDLDPPLNDCRIYLVSGDSKVIESFTQHCREAEAILDRMEGDGTRFNWAKELFENFRNAFDDEYGDVVSWQENEDFVRAETWSLIAELSDVFELTMILLKVFMDKAELRHPSPDSSMLGDEWNLTPILTLERPAGGERGNTDFEFRPDGDGYFVRGFGQQGHFTAKGAKGLHDIFRLVQSPGIPVPMLELDAEAGTKQLDGDSHSQQPVANSETRRDITATRTQLRADIENADSELERDELRAELETLEAEAKKMYGLRGKARDLNNPNDGLRAKLLGRKNRACKTMKDSGLSKLAEHLDSSIVSKGACLLYRSTTPNIAWDTEPKK